MAPSLGQGYSGSLVSTVVEGETSMRCAPKDGSGVGGSQAKVLSLSQFQHKGINLLSLSFYR